MSLPAEDHCPPDRPGTITLWRAAYWPGEEFDGPHWRPHRSDAFRDAREVSRGSGPLLVEWGRAETAWVYAATTDDEWVSVADDGVDVLGFEVAPGGLTATEVEALAELRDAGADPRVIATVRDALIERAVARDEERV